MASFPLLAVEDEGRLNDAGLREAFVERVFAAARLRALLSREREPRDLVEFHARHKLQLLAHDPARYRSLGQVVAGAGSAADYGELFVAALAGRATRGRNANALLHAYSRIGRALAAPRRSDLVARIDAYRRGEVPLSVPVALLAHYASGATCRGWSRRRSFRRSRPSCGCGTRCEVLSLLPFPAVTFPERCGHNLRFVGEVQPSPAWWS
jgi:uncharacterized protein YbgA (DUF1722 family)